MPTGIVLDQRYMAHDTGRGHPERPERIGVLLSALAGRPDLEQIEPRLATPDEVTLVHGEGHYVAVERTAMRERSAFDADTPVSRQSFEIARLATGGVLALIDAVMAGRVRNGFALVRPPGHHAERERAMGFCLFNNVAIGAAYLRAQHGLERVLVMDWDVHHGNGTQHVFAGDPGVLFVSSHRWPFYPGTGALNEVGTGEGRGFTINLPFPGGFGDAEYLEAFHAVVEPLALEYQPQFILISAGFDPHRRDPLGGMAVTEYGFASMAHTLCDVAGRTCEGRVVAVLEGGYDLEAMRDSASRVLDQLRGEPLPASSALPPSRAGAVLEAVKRLHGPQWKSL
ncbi:MAG: histone deacetylase [Candidatus Binatia bacterium]